jgi:hypothetical protein
MSDISVPFEGVNAVYKKQADNKDIRDLLVSLVPRAKKQMREDARKFKGRNERETCRIIFDYLKNNFQYVADGGEQIIKLPSALLRYRVGDCKSYSLFTSAILENLKIPYKFVYASYNTNPVPGHVYVVTDGGCIIDAVYGIFDAEKTPTYKYTQDMNVRYMGSVSPSGGGEQNANSAYDSTNIALGACGGKYPKSAMTRSANRGMNTGMTGPGFRRIALAPGRGLFLGIVKANLDGIASKLQKSSADKLKKTWENAGGDFSKLQNAIKIGASKTPKRLGLLGFIRKRLAAKGGVNGIGAAGENDIKAAIMAASTAVGTAIGTPGVGTGAGAAIGAALVAIIPIIIDLVKQTPDAEMTEVIIPNQVPAESDTPVTPGTTPGTTPGATPETAPGTKFSLSGALPIIAIGAGLYLATRKK